MDVAAAIGVSYIFAVIFIFVFLGEAISGRKKVAGAVDVVWSVHFVAADTPRGAIKTLA